MRVPPLNSLRVFEAAARHASFARAAAELYVTHGAVSRQVQQLEARIGVALFERRNRAVFLTDAGQDLQAVCAAVMAQLAEAFERIAAPPAHEPLVFSCEPTIAMRWLIPRLPAFRERFADQRLHLLTAGGPVDFARDRVDVALRRNDFPWGGSCNVESVAPEMMGPVCTAAIAARWPAPNAGRAKGQSAGRAVHTLHSRSRPTAWRDWLRLQGLALPADRADHFEHFYLCLQAAASGMGVAMASAYMAEDDVQGQRLVAPRGFSPDGSEYVLLSPVPFAEDARRMHLLAWLREEMGRTRAAWA